MARTRKTPTSASSPPVTGPNYMDAVQASITDLWDYSSIQLSAIAGTANAITATCDPVLTAGVTAGMKFSFVAANTNTLGVTIALNGGTPINIRDDNGASLIAGQVAAGRIYTIEFDGTNFRILNSSGVVKINNYQVFTASGTWNKPAGLPADALVYIELWGGGGGGGTPPAQNASGGGGGGGYHFRKMRAGDLASSVSVTVGAGGTPGNAGGTSSFGTDTNSFGGGGGGGSGTGSSRAGGGGGGGGVFGAGATGGSSSGSVAAGGAGNDLLGGDGGGATSNTGPANPGGTGYYGGGGGGGSFRTSGGAGTGADGGKALYGGGGGGGNNGNSGTAGIGGISTYAGNGGASGVAGSAPAGGGGGSANGARGEVRVHCIG